MALNCPLTLTAASSSLKMDNIAVISMEVFFFFLSNTGNNGESYNRVILNLRICGVIWFVFHAVKKNFKIVDRGIYLFKYLK